ncbi:MAG: hypothetical protein ACRC3Z_03575 [Phocaeicola sp.]
MKTVIKNITLLFLSLWLVTACTDDFNHPSQDRIPSAADIDYKIEVDQSTNEVTFTMNNKGCNPVWIFNGKEYSTVNGLTRLFAVAGTYEVEIKISNESGVSDGSKTGTFTLENTIVDFTRYFKMFGGDESKEWVIAKEEKGHLGCGPSGTDGLEWYSANANDKAGSGLYENIMTFSFAGNYNFNPGTAGTVFVNAGCSIFAEYNTTGEDFSAPVSSYDAAYQFTVVGNDVFLTLPSQRYLPYIPNDGIYQNPSFRVLSMKSNLIELVADNGEIAWHYTIVPAVHELSREEKMTGIWVWDREKAGHLSCGESGSDGTGWWSAMANEKEEFGIYNHQLIFTADGTYQFNPGETGTFYVNAGSSIYPEYNTGEDFMVPTTVQEATWTFVDEGADTFIEFPAQTIVSYVANDATWDAPKFKVLLQTETKLHILIDNGSIAWQYRFIKEGSGEDKEPPVAYDPESEFNLWKGATYTNSFYYAPDWTQIADPTIDIDGNSYTIKLPTATSDQWQAQILFLTDISTSSEINYDCSMVFNANQDLKKVTVKLVKEGDDDTAYFTDMISLSAYEDYLFSYTNMAGIDMEQVKLVLDFGGNPANTEITVSGIVLKNTQDDDGSR